MFNGLRLAGHSCGGQEETPNWSCCKDELINILLFGVMIIGFKKQDGIHLMDLRQHCQTGQQLFQFHLLKIVNPLLLVPVPPKIL